MALERRQLSGPCRLVQHSPSSLMNLLQDDLLVGILNKLPLNTVHRCKCVSKHWNSLISSDYFARCYVGRRNKRTPVFGIFCQNHRLPSRYPISTYDEICLAYPRDKAILKLPRFSLKFMSLSESMPVLSSDNGLLLCSDAFVYQSKSIMFAIHSLDVGLRLTIPPPPTTHVKWVRLGFICKRKAIDSITSGCEFVIVRMPTNYETGVQKPTTAFKVEIYTSETGEWAEFDLDICSTLNEKRMTCYECGLITSVFNAVACKGLMHWKVCNYILVFSPFYNNCNHNNSNGRYRFVQLPDKWHELAIGDFHLGESNGHLRYVYIHLVLLTLTVWVLRDYDNNGEWDMVHKISLKEMVFDEPKCAGFFGLGVESPVSFLAFHPFDGDIVFILIFGRVQLCNMRLKTIKTVHYFSSHWNRFSLAYRVVLPSWPVTVSHNPA